MGKFELCESHITEKAFTNINALALGCECNISNHPWLVEDREFGRTGVSGTLRPADGRHHSDRRCSLQSPANLVGCTHTDGEILA